MGRSGERVVGSADHALTLIDVLRRDGVIRVNAVAREMNVAPSTVHRLLHTLMFRGYAVRRPDHTYAPGPALPPHPVHAQWPALTVALHPLLAAVSRAIGETAHLVVRDGDSAVFLDSVVSPQALSIGSRTGSRLPAERNSGGKILLAQLDPTDIRQLYAPRADVDVDELLAHLTVTRRRGFGFSVAESERGITAISVCLPAPAGHPSAALSVSAPTLRLSRERALLVLQEIRAAVHL